MNYKSVSTPVADAICDRVNLEIKVQLTSGPVETRQTAEAIRKILAHRDELKEAEAAIAEGRIK